jgi:hemolysin activation/secretion protein
MGPDTPPMPAVEAPAAATMMVAEAPTQSIVAESNGYRYTVLGNTLLKPEVVKAALEGAADPRGAVGLLTQAYQKAGYFLVGLRAAVNVKDKEVNIQVVQGRISELDVAPALAPYFSGLKDRADLPRSAAIRSSINAESYAARQGMRPNLRFAPAAEYGGSKMTVTEEPIEGAKPWNANLGFGNYGNRYASRFIAQAGATLRPGDGLEFSASYSKGLPGLSQDSRGSSYWNGGVGASIITPWGTYGANYSESKYRIGDAAGTLSPQGVSRIQTYSGSQLLYADETTRWGLTESLVHTNSLSTAAYAPGIPYTIFDRSYDFASLGSAYGKAFSLFGLQGSASASLSYSKGLSPRNASSSGASAPGFPDRPGGADPHFGLFQGSISYSQSLPRNFALSLSANGQWADRTLPGNQQWLLGGVGNLSAWLPGIVSGDSGHLIRAVVSAPRWRWGRLSLVPSVFLEEGASSTSYVAPGAARSQWLSDAGLGLSGSFSKGTSLSLSYAVQLAAHNVSQSTLDSSRALLYFNLVQVF